MNSPPILISLKTGPTTLYSNYILQVLRDLFYLDFFLSYSLFYSFLISINTVYSSKKKISIYNE